MNSEANVSERMRLAPYLTVSDGQAALTFYQEAFDAEVLETYPYENKLGHASITVNDAEVMLADAFDVSITGMRSPESLGGTPVSISLNVDDPDLWFDRAVAAGATVLRPLTDEFYGRAGKIVDPFGHVWGLVGPDPRR